MNVEKRYISWDNFNTIINELASMLPAGKYTAIYGIPRGGVHVAQALSAKLGLPLTSAITKKTLVVDDIIDTGETIEKIVDTYSDTPFDIAVLHAKPQWKQTEFFKNIKEGAERKLFLAHWTEDWIVYPWELIDNEDEGIQKNVTRLLEYIGEDPKREGLLETPKRFEKAWTFWNSGYTQNPADIMKVFENPAEEIDQMVLVPKIDFYSMCEHHLAPFYGQIHIGYLPNKKVLGVSKFARLVNIYSRRLQIQERLTQQIAKDIMTYLEPKGVGVVVRAVHLCMRSRGVEKQNTDMMTSAMFGFFRDKREVRDEFLTLLRT